MKSVKIKVELITPDLFCQYRLELEWVWNLKLRLMLQHQCLKWYEWVAKQKHVDVELEGVIPTPLLFSKRSAYWYVSCKIADGGHFWTKDPKAPKIPYKNSKGETKHKYSQKLEPIRNRETKELIPYTRIEPVAYEPPLFGDKAFKGSVDNKKVLDQLRKENGLPPLTIHSDYIGGLEQQFKDSWNAYTSTKQQTRYKLKFKNERNPQKSLFNKQTKARKDLPYTIAPIDFAQEIWDLPGKLQLKPIDRSWKKRMGNLIPRSYSLIQEPSGFYLCVSCATEKEALLTKAKSKEEKEELRRQADEEIKQSLAYSRKTGNECGVDPGVRKRLALDKENVFFKGNHSRIKLKARIKAFQSKLDIMRDCNDKKQGKSWRKGERPATKNEAKLQAKISRLHERSRNSASMYNQKLSTRLVSTFDAIAWEDTQLRNMMKAAAPKMNKTGHFESNNAKAKSGLNESLALANIGQLRQMTEQKMNASGKRFQKAKAQKSSQKCHACGEIGERKDELFQCLNSQCNLHDVFQDADTNAAKNHRKALEQ